MRKPVILDSKGNAKGEPSTICPECASDLIEKLPLGGQDFDEHGWYQSQPYRCTNPECKHTWSEKIILVSGQEGVLIKHG